MKIIKRNGKKVEFDSNKIFNAINKAANETELGVDYELARDIADNIEEDVKELEIIPTVEMIQDMVEDYLMRSNRRDIAKRYILYRSERAKLREKGWEMTDLQRDIYEKKYRFNNETFEEFLDRVSGGNEYIKKAIKDKKFMPAGRILAGRGLDKKGRKITLSNCYVLPKVEDNIESIFDTAKYLARTYSYGGGVGLSISKLRPKGAKVNNAALTTTGSVSFAELYSLVTGLIGMRGRRGALMLNMDINHPDIEDFIDIKNDLNKVTKANISINIIDDFMKAVKNNEDYELYFKVEATGEEFRKKVNARELFRKIAKSNWNMAEPGMLFTDRINNWHLMSEDEDFEFAGVNPCFTGNMKLLTKDGYKTFEELEGKQVEIVNINGEITKGKVWCSGEKEAIKLILSNKKVIECTPDHVFMTADGKECKAKYLKGKQIMPYTGNSNIKEKAPYVIDIQENGIKKVYDFTEPKTHWGIVEGYIVHNCAEETLPAWGSCNLSSINLSAFVKNPFTDKAEFDFDNFGEMVRQGVIYLNEVLDENMELHPLPQQRQVAKELRQVGIGIMGTADMFIKMGIKYGSKESIELIHKIGKVLINEALRQSALLAKEYGTFPRYKKEAVLNSPFLLANANKDVYELIEKYGLRNSQLLTIPPTGSISTLIGCSNGVEPLFQISYIRKSESLHEQETYYKVFTPIAKEYMELHNITREEDLPDYFVTTHDISYKDRIEVQAAWQQYIDASISSTINRPEETTVEEIEELYMYAWERGLKGVTIYRNNCARSGILITNKNQPKTVQDKIEELQQQIDKLVVQSLKENPDICPMCGGKMMHSGGCSECQDCGYSPCAV